MRLTVFGATGGIGRQVVRQALDRGHEVVAVVRDRHHAPAAEARLEVVEVRGLDRPEELVPAVRGSDAAVSGVGPRGRRDGPVAAPVTAAVAEALRVAGVRRLVVVSAQPVGPAAPGEALLDRLVLRPLVSAVLAPVYRDLAEMERGLAATDLLWTAVRPPRLDDGPLTGHYRSAVGGAVPRARRVPRADVAHLVLELLADPASFRQGVGVAT